MSGSTRGVVIVVVGVMAWLWPGVVAAHDHPQKHTHLTMTNQARTAMMWFRDT